MKSGHYAVYLWRLFMKIHGRFEVSLGFRRAELPYMSSPSRTGHDRETKCWLPHFLTNWPGPWDDGDGNQPFELALGKKHGADVCLWAHRGIVRGRLGLLPCAGCRDRAVERCWAEAQGWTGTSSTFSHCLAAPSRGTSVGQAGDGDGKVLLEQVRGHHEGWANLPAHQKAFYNHMRCMKPYL